jgi:hypothetical protein
VAYYDDLVIVGRTIQAMKEAFMALETSARKMGLVVNEEETKFMEVGKKLTVAHFIVGNCTLEKVHMFKYLGSLVTYKNDISVEIKNRIGLGNTGKCYYGLRKHLGSRSISLGTKCLMYKTLIRPVVTYGAECWVLTKKDKLQLAVSERKVLRKISGPIRDTDQWRRRYNEDLYQPYAEPKIAKCIRCVRLRWAGHTVRIRESDPARKSTFDLLLGERTVGRPKMRWIQEVERELKGMGKG